MKRHVANPIITRDNIPAHRIELRDVSSVFNPGGIIIDNTYHLLLRVQNRARQTFTMKAHSADGVNFDISPEPIRFIGMDAFPYEVYHIYDPRVSRCEGKLYVVTAVDCSAGCRLALFESKNLEELSFKAMIGDNDLRNGVLFEDKFDGQYLMFARPNSYQGSDGVKTGNTIVSYLSNDLKKWEMHEEVFSGNPHYWDELIGSGPVPMKTQLGWIHIYHGVATHFGSSNIYQMGVSLHDLKKPWITIARGKYNIHEPREIYELIGQVPNVVFPTAALSKDIDVDGYLKHDAIINIYYGAADTTVCLAQSSLTELFEHINAK